MLVGELTFSGSYATGGDALDFAPVLKKIGSGQVMHVSFLPKAGYQFDYNGSTKKVIVRQGDNDGIADGPGIELPAAAYPAAITGLVAGNKVSVMVLGR